MKLELSQLLSDDDAVSPVIGVILMVAITVILAAVIGTFVLGLGQQVGKSAPTVTLNADDAGQNYPAASASGNISVLTIGHDNGDPLKEANLKITVRYPDNNSLVGTFNPASSDLTGNQWGGNNETGALLQKNGVNMSAESSITVGDSLTLVEVNTSGVGTTTYPDLEDGSDYLVTVIHVPSDTKIMEQTVTVE